MSGALVIASLEAIRRLRSAPCGGRAASICRDGARRGASCVKHRRSKGARRTAEMSGRRSDCAMGLWSWEGVFWLRLLGAGLAIRTFFWMLGCLTPSPVDHRHEDFAVMKSNVLLS